MSRASALAFNDQAARLLASREPNSGALAYDLWASSVLVDPNFSEGWLQVGNRNGDRNCIPAAVAAYRRCLELPDGSELGDNDVERRGRALVNLAWRLHHMGRNDEAREVCERAVEVAPHLGLGWSNLALLQSIDGDLDASVETAAKGFKLEPDNAACELQLAFCQLFARDFDNGLHHFEARFRYAERLRQFLQYPYPQWDGASGKVLALISEQGIGDTLSFSRFLPWASARCKAITAVVHPELLRLFELTFSRLANVSFIPAPNALPAADCWSTFVSLPTALGLSNSEIIAAPAPAWPAFNIPPGWKIPGRKLHIGVAWTGSPVSEINHHRSFPVTTLLELYRVPGIQLYSLQVGDRARDLGDHGCAMLIKDLNPHIRSVCDTLAILKDLDLLICTESAIGHIGAAAGIETWLPYSYAGRDYRLGHDGSQPLWYRKHRAFKQGRDMTWGPVFDRIVDELRRKVDGLK